MAAKPPRPCCRSRAQSCGAPEAEVAEARQQLERFAASTGDADADGALDVVAHPARIRDKARMDRVIDGAQGIEVYTSRHKAEIAAGFRARAEASGKHWSGWRKPSCG